MHQKRRAKKQRTAPPLKKRPSIVSQLPKSWLVPACARNGNEMGVSDTSPAAALLAVLPGPWYLWYLHADRRSL